jgi:ABC-2 type transport system ATP-binding protein
VSSGWPPADDQQDEVTFGARTRTRSPDAQPGADGAEPALPVAATAPGQDAAEAGPLAIASRGLAKRFRSGQLAVDDVDLAVPGGSVYGFLGPNGSGKTTTIRMLLGLVQPTGGSHQMLGVSMPEGLNAVLPKVGSLVEGPAFYSFLSGPANLERCDAADRTADPATAAARIGEALDRVGLSGAGRKHYRAYSLGMKQRLAIAAGLLQPRELMILDEPTNGLDPQGTREVRALIRQIAAEGTTVFVSSHLLAEVEQVCSHVGVMHRGKLLMQGTLDDLRTSAAPKLRVEADDPVRAAEVLGRMGMADVAVEGPQLVGTLDGLLPEDCCRSLVEAGIGVRMLLREQVSLEDAFVALTGEGFNVAG